MALSYVGQATGTNSATLPSFNVGDIAIVFAYRDGSNTPPSLPAGWNTILGATGANTNSARSGFRYLQSGDTTTGTWTNATSVICLVYRATGGVATVGASARGSGSSTTITYPAVTLQDPNGDSWGIRFAGHRSTNVTIETAPSGYTNRTSVSDATDEAAGFDSNGGITSGASGTASVGGTASGFEAHTIELRFDNRTAPTYRDSLSGGDSSFSVSSVNVPAPTVAVGDLEIIWAAAAFLAPTTAPTLTTPSGWTLGGTGASVSSAGGLVNTRAHMFWRISPDTGSSATLDAGASAVFVYTRSSYSGPDATRAFRQVVFGSTASSNSSVLSSINAAEDSLLDAFTSLGAAQAQTSPSGMTEREDDATYGVAVADEIVTTSGPTGTKTFTYTTATESVWGFAEFVGAEAATAYELTTNPGSYALTGSSARLERDLLIRTTEGSYSVTGSSARLNLTRYLGVTPGSYSLTGSAARTEHDALVNVTPGSYSLTGSSANLESDRRLEVSPGSYALTGSSAELIYTQPAGAFELLVTPGAYSITGSNAGLEADRLLIASPGSYSLTGASARLDVVRFLGTTAGSYALTGSSARLESDRVIRTTAGSYAITGFSAELTYQSLSKELIVTPGGYVITGYPAEMIAPQRRQGGGAPRRRGYIVKGQRYWLTDDELALLLARMLSEVKRSDVKVDGRKPKVLSNKTWNELQVTLKALEVLTTPEVDDSEDDDEEALLLLM
jgi:hypothetical protein